MEAFDILDNFNEGFCRWTPNWVLLKANDPFLRLTGIPGERPFFPIPDADKISSSFYELGCAVVRQLKNLEFVRDLELRLRRTTGDYCWLAVNARRVADDGGQTVHYDAYMRDITNLKLKDAELSHQIFYDHLTGIPNREFFVSRIQAILSQASKRRSDVQYALLGLDLRNFASVNLHYGRNFGDMLLCHTAMLLHSCCREADTVARLSSDEFGILLHGLSSGAQIIRVIKRIQAQFDSAFSALGQHIRSIQVDIGVIFPITDYSRPESVLRDVSMAIGRAKHTRNQLRCKFFSKKQLAKTRERLHLSMFMREQQDLGNFFLEYQPIVRPVDGKIHSFEALARWKPEDTLVSPAVFIPLAEENGFINRLGEFVLEESCRQLHCWQEKYGANVGLHVNISPHQLVMPTFPEKVLAILYRTGIDASRLFFEVTESALLNDFEKAIHNINAIRKQGIRFCLDDFGTGYSSLSYLKDIPIDCLKIDRSFIQNLEHDERAGILLEHILSLGMDLGYSLVIEGVENRMQLQLLGNLKHLLIQGYYFHRPLSAVCANSLLSGDGGAA
jgi:diguanylate cyclase (GGDEF)-like protein